MKSFVISIVAVLILFLGVILKSLYVRNICERLEDDINDIEGIFSSEKVDEVIRLWDENKFLISLSVPHKQTDDVEKNLILLKEKTKILNPIDFYETKALLLNSVNELSNHGAISADNIF